MQAQPQAKAGPTAARTLHVHPSLFCNLTCRHCYSGSSPQARDAIPFARIAETIADAAALGYGVLSVSGGEPFLYRELRPMLELARAHGMATTIVTNGTRLDRADSQAALALCDIVAVSFDGLEETHNAMRGSPRAWADAMAGLAVLRDRARPFGMITTASRESWWQAEPLADLAAEHGAALLQIHPFEAVGRGAAEAGLALDETDTLRLFILAGAIAGAHSGRLRVQLDLVHRTWIAADPARFYAAPEAACAASPSVLVLQADGRVVPVSHGVASCFAVTDVHQRRLADAWPDFLAGPYRALLALCQAIAAAPPADVFDWHDLLIRRSHARA